MEINNQVQKEMQAARNKYGTFHSTHEVYGVLKEEVDEFWELVKTKPDGFWKINNGDVLFYTRHERVRFMISELKQIAAVALRAAQELENGEIKFV